jgi:hypothetical protein
VDTLRKGIHGILSKDYEFSDALVG